jgi:hypothetical protein
MSIGLAARILGSQELRLSRILGRELCAGNPNASPLFLSLPPLTINRQRSRCDCENLCPVIEKRATR